MLSLKGMRQQCRPIHCKHLSLIESTTASVTLRNSGDKKVVDLWQVISHLFLPFYLGRDFGQQTALEPTIDVNLVLNAWNTIFYVSTNLREMIINFFMQTFYYLLLVKTYLYTIVIVNNYHIQTSFKVPEHSRQKQSKLQFPIHWCTGHQLAPKTTIKERCTSSRSSNLSKVVSRS